MDENPRKFRMRYTVATNFDPEVVETIAANNQDGVFVSVYGKLRKDIVGGGRSSITLPKLSKNALLDYIKLCHRNGLKFNYLLNPICLANREFVRRDHRGIQKLLGELSEAGVDNVTINSPYLCELIKKQFPGLRVTVGHYAHVFTVQQVKYWEELGADEITLQHHVNRNFPLLEEMLRHTKTTGTGLRIIGNNFCLHDCPFAIYHATGLSHSSDIKQRFNRLYIDYNLIRCNTAKIKDPSKLMASDWVRPEDVVYYEQLCEKTGNTNFLIKLVDRAKTTEFLRRVIGAYAAHSYHGNLLEIVNWGNLANIQRFDKKALIIGAITGSYNLRVMRGYGDVFKLPEVVIDNQKLDGFFEKYVRHYDCDSRICGDFYDDDGKHCGYCREWARKAVVLDRNEVDRWLEVSGRFLDDLSESRLFL